MIVKRNLIDCVHGGKPVTLRQVAHLEYSRREALDSFQCGHLRRLGFEVALSPSLAIAFGQYKERSKPR